MTNTGPLNGITVLDFSLAMAGPFAAQKLGDLGADVIKVEPIGSGEWHRAHAAGNAWVNQLNSSFIAFNRNKRSLAINLKHPSASAIVGQLVSRTDVAIQNFRPGVSKRLSIDYESLRKINKSIVYCSMSGYGERGSLAQNPGQDLLLQGYSGAMWNVGKRGDPPQPSIYFACDATSANLAVQGVLAALYYRARTGVGQKVEVDMLSGAIDLQAQEMSVYLTGNVRPERGDEPLAHSLLPAPYGVYKTRDGYVTLAMGSLSTLADALDENRLRRFVNDNDGLDHRDEIYRIVAGILPRNTSDEWLKVFASHGLWAGPVYDYDDLLADPQVMENGMIVEMDHPTEGRIRATGIPIRFSVAPGSIRLAPPLVGQHTDEILGSLGYSPTEISTLRSDGVVSGQ